MFFFPSLNSFGVTPVSLVVRTRICLPPPRVRSPHCRLPHLALGDRGGVVGEVSPKHVERFSSTLPWSSTGVPSGRRRLPGPDQETFPVPPGETTGGFGTVHLSRRTRDVSSGVAGRYSDGRATPSQMSLVPPVSLFRSRAPCPRTRANRGDLPKSLPGVAFGRLRSHPPVGTRPSSRTDVV